MAGVRYIWDGKTWVPAQERQKSDAPYAVQSGLWEGWGTVGALAVHPGQVKEANARLKRHGIVGAYDQKGNVHVPDRANRKKLLRLEGMHDNLGGYGD